MCMMIQVADGRMSSCMFNHLTRDYTGSASLLRCHLVRRALLLILPLVLLAGCKDTGASSPPETIPDPTTTLEPPSLPSTTATTTLADPFAVPAVIDLAYVQRVLEAIYHLDGELTRHIYAKKLPDAEFEARLRAIFAGEELAGSKRILQENAAEGFARFANPPGDPVVRATEIIQATPTCMVVRAELDFRPQYKNPGSKDPPAVIELRRFEVLPFNPTGWGVLFAGEPTAGLKLEVCS
jgi:hypothetical protein